MVIPATILPAFGVAFVFLFRFSTVELQALANEESAALANDAHGSVGASVFTLVLMTVGIGDNSLWSEVTDVRVVTLLLLFVLFMPIMALNLLIAMMADTYIDVRSAAMNRWSLAQAQYVLSRQRYAGTFVDTHFPRLDNGYECRGVKYDDFYSEAAAKGEAEDPVENLRKSTYNEAKRAGRLAEVAVEGIGGLNDAVSAQLSEITQMLQETQRANAALGAQLQQLKDGKSG